MAAAIWLAVRSESAASGLLRKCSPQVVLLSNSCTNTPSAKAVAPCKARLNMRCTGQLSPKID